MTYDDFETRVRDLVNDRKNARFPSATVRRAVRDAVKHLRNLCPSERYGADGRLDDALPDIDAGASDDDGGAELPDVRVDARHEEAVVKYAAHLLYQLDMTDTVNQQVSETLRTRAEALMQL